MVGRRMATVVRTDPENDKSIMEAIQEFPMDNVQAEVKKIDGYLYWTGTNDNKWCLFKIQGGQNFFEQIRTKILTFSEEIRTIRTIWKQICTIHTILGLKKKIRTIRTFWPPWKYVCFLVWVTGGRGLRNKWSRGRDWNQIWRFWFRLRRRLEWRDSGTSILFYAKVSLNLLFYFFYNMWITF